MEFEEYYELRFGRKPKLLRKATPCPGADVARASTVLVQEVAGASTVPVQRWSR
jgi:hypothetical protein